MRSYGGESYRRLANLMLVSVIAGMGRQEGARLTASVHTVDKAAGRECRWESPVMYARV